MRQSQYDFLIKSVFDIPNNPYVIAVLRIERFKNFCLDIGEKGLQSLFEIKDNGDANKEIIRLMFLRSLDYQKKAKEFLKTEGVIDADETFTDAFRTDNPNPLIADAAYYYFCNF